MWLLLNMMDKYIIATFCEEVCHLLWYTGVGHIDSILFLLLLC